MAHCSNVGMPKITSVDFELTSELDSTTPTFTLTCTSTGGPVTIVCWTRDGEVLTENSNYNITSWMLLNPENATYTHTLRVTGRLVGEYERKLSNIRTPSSSRNLTVEGEYKLISQSILMEGEFQTSIIILFLFPWETKIACTRNWGWV